MRRAVSSYSVFSSIPTYVQTDSNQIKINDSFSRLHALNQLMVDTQELTSPMLLLNANCPKDEFSEVVLVLVSIFILRFVDSMQRIQPRIKKIEVKGIKKKVRILDFLGIDFILYFTLIRLCNFPTYIASSDELKNY